MPRFLYNHKRDIPDPRDYKFNVAFPNLHTSTLPTCVDLRKDPCIPGVLDQGNLGSCTANATSNALLFCLKKEKLNSLMNQPSRLFIYYYSRLIENTVNEDSGCFIRDVMKAVQVYGACDEKLWPYNISTFTICPSTQAIQNATTHKKFNYYSVQQNLNSLKNALAQGFPIIFGIMVYESLESDIAIRTGNIPMPNTSKEKLLGGHCILLTGYDDNTKLFTFMNSWGKSVGKNGFFTLPYQYVLDPNLSSDFWTIKFWC